MKAIKCFILSIGILVLLPNSASAQFATIDTAAIATSMKQIMADGKAYAQEAERWGATLNRYKEQLGEWQKQYKSLTGSGKYLEILNQVLLGINEMEHVNKLFDNIVDVINDPELSINNASKAIREQFDTYNSCAIYEKNQASTEETQQALEKTKKACTLMFNAEYMDVTGMQDLLEQIKETEKRLNEARQAFNAIKDSLDENNIKSAQDLANLISMLQTNLQSQKDKLEAFRDSVKSLKTMAQNTIEQIKLLASKESAGLQNYGKKRNGNSNDDE